jgi:N-6 DNA Methylase
MLSTTSRPYLFAGNLLVTDITKDLVSNDYPGQMPKDFDLGEKAKLADEIALVWGIAKAHWVAFQQALGRLDENDPATSVTREQWVLPLLRALGYDPFYTAKAEIIDNQTYAISHRSGQRRRNVEVAVDQRMAQCEGSYDLLGTANLENKPPLHIIGCRVGLEKRSESGKPRISAHGLLQEYLNRTEHLWGVVTNGLQWRLLRDSSLMTKLTYVEFDLDQIMKGENFAEFGLFYRLFHRSRLPENMEDSNKCLLEDYHQLTLQQGGRVRDKLRDGVEKSIEQLANGFLQHPKNEALRLRVASGEILATEYYRQLLMLIYRLLFLMVAESRDLLLNDHETDLEQRRIYEAYYSIEKLRLLAESPSLRREGFQDLWRGLMVTFQLFDEHWRGQALGLSPLNGDLFGSKALSYIDGYAIDNYDLLTAIKNLSRYDHVSAKGQAAQSRRVNYESLDVEELGSIYESLLDFHPQISAKNAGYEFELVKGSDRKSTGSYYTPPELVAQLIKTALEPVIADKLAGLSSIAEREAALLSITVCDPSCGSGHFLLAAARRLGKELARVRTEEHQPGMDDLRPAVRDVIQRCIYGVDLNPLAIDLCKVALWIEGYNKNRPLSFLDHRIKCGNSLVGVLDLDCLAGGIPDGAFNAVTGDDKSLVTKLKKRNKDELKDIDQRCLWDLEVVRAGRVSYALSAEQVGAIEETTAQDVKSKQESYLLGRSDAVWLRDYTLCNVWTAAFFTPLLEQQLGVIPTTAVLFSLMTGSSVFQKVAEAANALAAEKSFFHWCLEFPEVFQDGGFSCILGNPPWGKIKLEEKRFFAANSEILNAKGTTSRTKLIEKLEFSNPSLHYKFKEAEYDTAAQGRFVRESDRYKLTSMGDINKYAIFAETARSLISNNGRAGIIIPTEIATGDTYKDFFCDLTQKQNLASLYDFENRESLFKDVGTMRRFCLISMSGGKVRSSEFLFLLTNSKQIDQPLRRFSLTVKDIDIINPNTLTAPTFRTNADAELTKKIYRTVPVLENERTGVNPWGISFMTMFHMSNDDHLFQDYPNSDSLSLYEGKMLHQFDHRFGYYTDEMRDRDQNSFKAIPSPSIEQKQDPHFKTESRKWVDRQDVDNKLAGKWDKQWLLAFRDITNATNERTSIASLLPKIAVGHKAPLIFTKIDNIQLVSCLLGNLNTLAFDFVARQKVGGTNMCYFLLRQLPVLSPESYTPQDIEFISSRVLELVYTAWDMQPFAQDMGYEGAPFVWNPERRALLRAELDAKYAKLYGLTRDELRYILDPSDIYGAEFPSETFRVLKKNELKEHGEYRTQRLVLAAWDSHD